MQKELADLIAAFAASPAMADAPLRDLLESFVCDCEARNLQPGTIEFYTSRLAFVVGAYGDMRARDVSTAHLQALIEFTRRERGWNVQNANHLLEAIKVFYNWLERQGVIDRNPTRRISKLRQEKRHPAVFTEDEIRALLRACDKTYVGIRDRVIIVLLLDTGMRVSELAGLTVRSLDLTLSQLLVYGKGRKERLIPVSPTTKQVLSRYLTLVRGRFGPSSPETPFFRTESGEGITRFGVRYRLEVIGRAAGVEGVHPHRFRHTFATMFLRAGGNPAMLQRLLGHTGPQMTALYTHLVDLDAVSDHRKHSPIEALGRQ